MNLLLLIVVLVVLGISNPAPLKPTTAKPLKPKTPKPSKGLQNKNMYGGDMIVKTKSGKDKTLVEIVNPVWTDGTVYVEFTQGVFTPEELGEITAGINLIERQTESIPGSRNCIKFEPRTNQANYVSMIASTGCWSYVGMISGKQELSLGAGCVYIGTVAHEFIHALGFLHEQQRPDRDSYLKINFQNIDQTMVSNFDKNPPETVDVQGLPYDFQSIMHYGNTAFSIDGIKPSMERLVDPQVPLLEPYSKFTLSDLDIQAIRKRYNCV